MLPWVPRHTSSRANKSGDKPSDRSFWIPACFPLRKCAISGKCKALPRGKKDVEGRKEKDELCFAVSKGCGAETPHLSFEASSRGICCRAADQPRPLIGFLFGPINYDLPLEINVRVVLGSISMPNDKQQ